MNVHWEVPIGTLLILYDDWNHFIVLTSVNFRFSFISGLWVDQLIYGIILDYSDNN